MENIEKEYIGEKRRHGCVTAWLLLMILANSLLSLVYLFAGDTVVQDLPVAVPLAKIYSLGILGVVNVVSATMLFTWKKIGFFGFIVSGIAGIMVNISIGLGVFQSVFGLIGIAVLYGILQIKQNGVSAWDNLE